MSSENRPAMSNLRNVQASTASRGPEMSMDTSQSPEPFPSTSQLHETALPSAMLVESDTSASSDEDNVPTPSLLQTGDLTLTLSDSSRSQLQSLDTTFSQISEKKVRTRIASKWICTFQIMDVPPNFLHGQNSEGSFPIADEESIANTDNWLKEFFRLYKKHARQMRKNNIEILHALGGRYMYHMKPNLIVGIVVLETQMCNSPQFNSHLLLEKFSPNDSPLFGCLHKTVIGTAYPIHTTDISCIGGNSLRPLLTYWIDDFFFKSLHWLIPPSSPSMRRLDKEEAEIRDEEAMMDFIELIKEMKKILLKNYRVTLSEPQTHAAPSQSLKNTNTSMYKYIDIHRGREYRVESHHWCEMLLPLNKNGSLNEFAYREVKFIKSKGGRVKTISKK